jgi:zinc protease
MQVINRAIQPTIHSGFSFKLMQYNRHEFANGCVLYNFPYDILPVARLEFIFSAGRKFQKKPLIAGFTGKMLFEGTSVMNQQQIADAIDITGATVNAAVNEDYAVLTVICTTVNLSDVLKQLHHVLTDSVFPAEQLKIHTDNDKQEYLINLQKVSFLARRKFIQTLFPEHHPYAQFAEEKDFDHVTQNDVISFFQQYYHFNQCMVSWTGHISHEHFRLFERLFGDISHDEYEQKNLI